MLRVSGDCLHNLGAFQSIEMGEMRRSQLQTAGWEAEWGEQ